MNYVMLLAVLPISRYVKLMFYLFIQNYSFLYFHFIKAPYNQTMVGVPLVTSVPQFEGPYHKLTTNLLENMYGCSLN
jgi:hypothetical protein